MLENTDFEQKFFSRPPTGILVFTKLDMIVLEY